MDIKPALFGSVLSLAVGGGISGLYLKNTAPAAFTEATSYELIGKCVLYNSNPQFISLHMKEIESFLDAVKLKYPEIAKADAITSLVAASAGERNNLPAGMGTPLRRCVQYLTTNVERVRK